MSRLARPERNEYAEYYARYIDRVPDDPILDALARQLEESLRLLAGVERHHVSALREKYLTSSR
ncbi:MAG: hypothetical protein ACT4PE_05210 [Candidatus Eiseniibacteriota bacterium]